MTFAKSERNALCDLFLEVGPDAPTLCEGWTTHDLAAHLWVREADPVAAPGMVVKQLAGLTERRMDAVKAKFSWQDLVERIRRGPARFSVFSLPGVDEPTNAIEFFVHHEDVRRAGEKPLPPRDLDPDYDDFLWKRLGLMGTAMFRHAGVGVVLEREGHADAEGCPMSLRARSGTETVTVVGSAQELTLLAHGRGRAAHLRYVGDPDSIAVLHASDLSI